MPGDSPGEKKTSGTVVKILLLSMKMNMVASTANTKDLREMLKDSRGQVAKGSSESR